MQDEGERLEFARMMAEPQTLAALIDQLPNPAAVELLKVWRQVYFGPPRGGLGGANPGSAETQQASSDD